MSQLVFAREAATITAIEQASYRMAGRLCVCTLPQDSNASASYICEVEPKGNESEAELISEFRMHVNDYFLRELISARTEGIRTLLFAQAFSGLSCSDES